MECCLLESLAKTGFYWVRLFSSMKLRVSISIWVSNKWVNNPLNPYRFYRLHLFALALSCQYGRSEKGSVVLLFILNSQHRMKLIVCISFHSFQREDRDGD